MNQSKFIIATLAIFFSTLCFAQSQKKFSIEVSYPLPVSESFENYNGVIAGGIKYNFKETSALILGASYNLDYFTGNFGFNNEDNKLTALFHHFNIIAEFKLASLEKLHFLGSAGYSLGIRKNDFNLSNTDPSLNGENKFTSNGFNIQLGATYDFAKSFYAKAYFRYIGLYEESDVFDETKMEDFNTINLGIGFRF